MKEQILILQQIEKPHVAYACIGIFTTIFSLVSLFVKEKLYIGEATVAAVTGLIIGPHCLGWFEPTTWGSTDRITLEISRIVLCVQIFAVAVELPKKYMLKHWVSVFIFLVPVMTCGWLIVGLFIWILIPGLNFSSSLLISACVTATDPVLASAVVGKGKFAERVPGHLRNILSAESGCNDGMAFPFIFLSLNLVIHPGNAGEIVKDWFLLTILWECVFGCILGAIIGYLGRHAIAFAESKNLIDRESFLAFYIVLAFTCAGVGSMLGVDDLLVSFAAGAAFAWNGWFAKKTEETHVSTVIDLLLNLSYFVYFGAIIPWEQYNNAALGLNAWRLVLLALVVIFLRRIPAVLALKPLTPDVKTWREALFCGHFGPIGVGAVFAAILARKDLEASVGFVSTAASQLPEEGTKHYQLIATIWPIVTFLIITSIIVHGSSVAVMTLGRHLNAMAITMSFSQTQGNQNSSSWMSRLSKLESNGRTFSLHRIDTENTQVNGEPLPKTNTVETSGVPVRPAGGMMRRKNKDKRTKRGTQNAERTRPESTLIDLGGSKRPHPVSLQLSKVSSDVEDGAGSSPTAVNMDNNRTPSGTGTSLSIPSDTSADNVKIEDDRTSDTDNTPTMAYKEGNQLFVENESGEIIETVNYDKDNNETPKKKLTEHAAKPSDEEMSIHSIDSLRRNMSKFTVKSSGSGSSSSFIGNLDRRPSYVGEADKIFLKSGSRKDGPEHHRLYAFKLDDQIIIENSEGEIVRRYRVNRHGSTSATGTRSRSASMISGVNRALSFVGLKSKDSNAPTQITQSNSTSDVEANEKSNTALVPEYDNLKATAEVDQQLEDRLKTMLINDSIAKPAHGTLHEEDEDQLTDTEKEKGGPNIPESHEDDEEDSEENDEDVDGDEEEEETEETEVEKIRRLTALGEYHATRDSDDEED